MLRRGAVSERSMLKVLMVTGVFFPEINGAVLQGKSLIGQLSDRVSYSVFTQTRCKELSGPGVVEGCSITRIWLGDRSLSSLLLYGVFFVKIVPKIVASDVIHIFGYSRRNSLVIVLARFFGRPSVLRMSSLGLDDPSAVKSIGGIYWLVYRFANKLVGLSPAFSYSSSIAGIEDSQYKQIENAVDINRFRSVSLPVRVELRKKYNIHVNNYVVLFVGHFSPEKQPNLVFDAWLRLRRIGYRTTLIMVGRRSGYEVENRLFRYIMDRAYKYGVVKDILFIENAQDMQDLMGLSDVFVLPSLREGLPNALLEAMSTSLPCVVSELRGVSDWLIQDQISGVVLQENTPANLARVLRTLFRDSELCARLGAAARSFVEANFSQERTARLTLDLYREITADAFSK